MFAWTPNNLKDSFHNEFKEQWNAQSKYADRCSYCTHPVQKQEQTKIGIGRETTCRKGKMPRNTFRSKRPERPISNYKGTLDAFTCLCKIRIDKYPLLKKVLKITIFATLILTVKCKDAGLDGNGMGQDVGRN